MHLMLLLLIALVTGALSALAFEPVGLWVLMPVAFAVLLGLLWRTETLGRALLVGWLFGFGQFAVALNWIAHAFSYQAAMPAWLGWVAVVLLALYLAIYPALAAGLAWRFGKDNEVAMVLALAGGWAITEWLRAGIFTGFAWNPAAAAMAPTPLIGISALIGTYGLSALTVLLGAVIWLEVQRKWLPGVLIVLATVILWLLPASRVPETPLAVKPVRIIQPNIDQADKWRPGFAEQATQRLAALSGQPGGERPRLLFWPEAAVTEPLDDQRAGPFAAASAQERSRAAASVGENEYLLTGALGVTSPDGRQVSRVTNSVFVIAPDGQARGRYDKAHLVPFGEYLPMRPLLSRLGLSRLAPGEIDFNAGPGPRTIYLPGWGRVGVQVCYEIIFSGHVVDWQRRPDFIFNPSNDAWFGRWGPPQHLAQARLRAAEEGLPVVRSTPTGISALIDARGRIVKQIGWKQAGVIDATLPAAASKPTPFAHFGNAIPLLLAAAMLVAAIALTGARRYRRQT